MAVVALGPGSYAHIGATNDASKAAGMNNKEIMTANCMYKESLNLKIES